MQLPLPQRFTKNNHPWPLEENEPNRTKCQNRQNEDKLRNSKGLCKSTTNNEQRTLFKTNPIEPNSPAAIHPFFAQKRRFPRESQIFQHRPVWVCDVSKRIHRPTASLRWVCCRRMAVPTPTDQSLQTPLGTRTQRRPLSQRPVLLAQLSQLGGQIAISKIFFPHNASIMPQMVSNPAW